MVNTVINSAKSELSNRPLVAVDILLQAFSEIKQASFSDDIHELLTLFSCAILTNEKVDEIIWKDNPIEGLFNRELNQDTRRFIGICLLRLLAVNKACFSRKTDFGIKVFMLFDEVFSKDLYPQFKVELKDQGYDKQNRLETVIPSIEGEIKTIISSLNSLEMLSKAKFRETFTGAIRHKKHKAILNPFLPKDLINVRLDEIFGTLENYLEEKESRMLQAFEKASDILVSYKTEADQFGTTYSCYLAVVANKLLELLLEHFESNPTSKPAEIVVVQGEKKYPFSTTGRCFNVSFTITNNGPGYAFDVYLTVSTDDLILEKSEIYLGNLEPTSVIVEIPAQIKKLTKTVYSIVELKWTNFDKTSNNVEYDFILEGQRSDIDWDKLKKKAPYRLEPVTTANELVGRIEILNQLADLVEAESVGSSYIYGQKRVGKTSIANALKSYIENSNPNSCLIVYLEGGDYITPDPKTTIQQLGEILCNKIQESERRFSNLVIPMFDNGLAPLSRFLDSVLRIAPNYKILFILDEFDELPSEIYRSEEIGRAFFLTLRSISGKPPFGFILVGGEKMEFIMSYQGIALNKFDSVSVDYFDRQRHWSDFQELVLKPLPQGIEFSNTALLSLYEQTAGNPFFTKLICRTLFKILVERRDSHVTRREVEEATKLAAHSAKSERFQHFWLDGIFDTGTRSEATKVARRRVLVALAEIFRKHTKVEKDEIIKRAQQLGLSDFEIETVLMDFVRRKVLLLKENLYECKVPFFGEWLKEKGIQEIINMSEDLDVLLKDKKQQEETRIRSEEIVRLVRTREFFYKSQLINEDRIRAWLSQFNSDEFFHQFDSNEQQRLMFQILQNLTFYSRSQVRTKLKEAHDMIVRDLRGLDIFWNKGERKLKRSDILVSYLDGPGKSGANYAKLYAEENDIYRGEGGNVVELTKLGNAIEQKQNLQALIFIDDFVGTGHSVSEYFEELVKQNEGILRNNDMPIFFIAICGFIKGKSNIESILERIKIKVKVRLCDVLDDTANCFGETSRIFPNSSDRARAKAIAFHYGNRIEKRAPLGFGDCEATVVFEDSCPNNTLPILWAEAKDWIPLFKRT